MYRVVTASSRSERQIRQLEAPVRARVLSAIRSLGDDPRPPGSRKLGGAMRGAWRIRVGDYRVLYDVDESRRTVVVLEVLHRRRAYRRG